MANNRAITSIVLNNKFDANTSADLVAPGLLAKRPLIGLTLFLMGSLIFGALAYNLYINGPLIQWDTPLYHELYAKAINAPARINEIMLFGFFMGKELIQVMVVILGLYLLNKRLWRELAMVIIGSGGGSLVWRFFNTFFDRPRPEAQIGITVTNPSFPSGHVMSAVIFYGLLGYLLVPKMPSLFWKWIVVITVLFILAFAGFSRIFQGGHYLTDVIAGYALGIAWAGLVYTLIERTFKEGNFGNV